MKNSVVSTGLAALARAGTAGNCYQGHFGSAMLASYFMSRDLKVPKGIVAALEKCRQVMAAQEPTLFLPERQEKAAPKLIGRLKNHLLARIGDLSRSGHVSIVGMYALRGFLESPESVTPSRVEGIIQLIEAYMKERPEPRYYGYPFNYRVLMQEGAHEIPEYRNAADAFNLAISEVGVLYPDADVQGVYYYFTGEKLHGLTHAHALYELERMGEGEIARLAFPAHRLQVLLNRARSPRQKPIRGTSRLTLNHVEFWKLAPGFKHQLGVPHAIKRSYALLRAQQSGLKSANIEILRKLSYVLQRW